MEDYVSGETMVRGFGNSAGIYCCLLNGQPQDYVIYRFNDLSSESQWMYWCGLAPQRYALDWTMDADNVPNSGSPMAVLDFDVGPYGAENQFAFRKDFPGGQLVNGLGYVALAFDLRWTDDSPKRNSGDFGYSEVGFLLPDWSQIWIGGLTITDTYADRLVHVEIPIDPTVPRIDQLAGVVFKMWAGGQNGLTGQTIFWLDNVKLIANPNPQVQPPSLLLSRPVAGLSLMASAPGQQWQRQSIRTVLEKPEGCERLLTWVGNGAPVSYSFTIKEFPGVESSWFQAHMFLVPDLDLPFGPDDASIDWNAPHVVFFQVVLSPEGFGQGRLMYKVKQPGGNSMLWNTDPANGPGGTLLIITNSTVIGRWTVTFLNDRQIRVTAPDQTSAEAALPLEDLVYFATWLFVYFGIQPNSVEAIGSYAVFEKVAVTGLADGFEEPFIGRSLDPTRLRIVAADAAGIFLVPETAIWQASWTLPDVGFQLQLSPTLVPASWVTLDTSAAVQGRGTRSIFLESSELPDGPSAFFRMRKAE